MEFSCPSPVKVAHGVSFLDLVFPLSWFDFAILSPHSIHWLLGILMKNINQQSQKSIITFSTPGYKLLGEHGYF